jgi:nuclear transport factor 2 (NTF2) superfamily protein
LWINARSRQVEEKHRAADPSAIPPIDEETARQKVKAAQDAWNTRDPEKVSLAYTEDSVWRNRDEFFQGREAIRDFLTRKWARELDYRLEKNLWCFTGNRIAVRFEYESRDAEGNWWRSHLYDRIATPSHPAAAGRVGPGVLPVVAP